MEFHFHSYIPLNQEQSFFLYILKFTMVRRKHFGTYDVLFEDVCFETFSDDFLSLWWFHII
jgi:hypothetical protein